MHFPFVIARFRAKERAPLSFPASFLKRMPSMTGKIVPEITATIAMIARVTTISMSVKPLWSSLRTSLANESRIGHPTRKSPPALAPLCPSQLRAALSHRLATVRGRRKGRGNCLGTERLELGRARISRTSVRPIDSRSDELSSALARDRARFAGSSSNCRASDRRR